MKLVVGISGASGAPYAKRLLHVLRETVASRSELQVHVVLSRTAEQVWAHECGGHPADLGFATFHGRDYSAPCASGSAGFEAMAVVPASMSCIARIAQGISDDLLTRAADVMLKERRTLLVMPREAPYSELHLENMLKLSRLGVTVLPASPSFYGRPETLEAAMDTVLSRALDHVGVPNALQRRWGTDIRLASSGEEAVDPAAEDR